MRKGIKRSPRFHWWFSVTEHKQTLGEFKYDKDEIYHVIHYMVTHFIQVYFLWWVFFLDVREPQMDTPERWTQVVKTEVEDWVDAYTNTKGHPPTYKQVADALRITKTVAYYKLDRYRRLGKMNTSE